MLDRNVVTQRITESAVISNPRVEQVLADASAGDVTATLVSRSGGMEHKVAVQKTDSSGGLVNITAGSISVQLASQNDAALFEQDDLGAWHVFAASGTAVGSFTIPAGESLLASATEYSDVGSYQPVAPDLNLAAGAGSDDGSDPSYLGTVMGNVLGADLTEDANYIGGVIGAYSVTGVKATEYPSGAVLAQITDGVTDVQGAVTAYIDGDGSQTNANAAFAIMQNNSVPGSGFDWVVDGHGEAHNGYNAAVPLKGFARINVNSVDLPVGIYFGIATDDVGIVAQVGADATIGDGSLYISHVDGAGKLFQKQNDVWVDLQA